MSHSIFESLHLLGFLSPLPTYFFLTTMSGSSGKYVPPHSRRGTGAGSSNSRGRGSSVIGTSRWSNLNMDSNSNNNSSSFGSLDHKGKNTSSSYENFSYDRTRQDRGQPNRGDRFYSNYGGAHRESSISQPLRGTSSYPRSSSDAPGSPSARSSNSSNSGKSSRWANVTDPSLRNPAPPQPSSPKSKGSSVRSTCNPLKPPPPPIKVAFFGDSFVRLFGLVEPHRRDVMVTGFKGASAKGLGRLGNDNRDLISNFVKSPRGNEVERMVFVFGSVDVHLSYYYKKYVKGEEIDLNDIAVRYVDFVADLLTKKGVIKTVVGVYFSPLADADVGPSLASYGSLTAEQAALVSGSNDAELRCRQERVMAFNRALKEHCTERGVEYDDINDVMTDPETYQIKDAYRDVSNHNIHIVWETTLLLWLDRWGWLKEGMPPSFAEGLQRTLEEYLKTKPWAERKHVAQSVGVDQCVKE